jgi:hypothetical protein
MANPPRGREIQGLLGGGGAKPVPGRETATPAVGRLTRLRILGVDTSGTDSHPMAVWQIEYGEAPKAPVLMCTKSL